MKGEREALQALAWNRKVVPEADEIHAALFARGFAIRTHRSARAKAGHYEYRITFAGAVAAGWVLPEQEEAA